MYALSHYTRGTLGLVNLFCRTWSISSLNGVKFYAEGGKWECRHQYPRFDQTQVQSYDGLCGHMAMVMMSYNILAWLMRQLTGLGEKLGLTTTIVDELFDQFIQILPNNLARLLGSDV